MGEMTKWLIIEGVSSIGDTKYSSLECSIIKVVLNGVLYGSPICLVSDYEDC